MLDNTFNCFSQWLCGLTAVAAGYGLLLQDVVAITVSIATACISLGVFIAGRIEARLQLNESRRHTAAIERLTMQLEELEDTEHKALLIKTFEAAAKGKLQ